MESLRGQLLVAGPSLIDPNFRRTVVLVAEHDEEGAMGVVLNRPTEATVADVLPDLVEIVPGEEPLFSGGPVGAQGVVVLARFTDPTAAVARIAGNVGFLAADQDLAAAATTVRRARAYAGHAGWGPGQLDAELADDGWIVVPHEPDDLFSEGPESLWSRVLERQGGSYALVARMPLDPSLN